MKVIDKTYVYIGLMVLLGSMANALAQLSDARKSNIAYGIIDFGISIGVSIFAGTMAGLVAHYFTSDELVILGVAGAGGYMGLNGLNRLQQIALDFIAARAKVESDRQVNEES